MFLTYQMNDWTWPDGVRVTAAEMLKRLTTFSALILVGLIAGMLFAARAVVMRPETRRNTGMAWAFGAFWPRAAHPFAPASWTVRTVPELVHRIEYVLSDSRTRVLLHAHSMGTVLAIVALWQIKPELRSRVALLTTGSPIRSYFARHYPAFVVDGSLRALVEPGGGKPALAGWTNIWRNSDPMAGGWA